MNEETEKDWIDHLGLIRKLYFSYMQLENANFKSFKKFYLTE